LVIASNEIIFGGDFELFLEICVVQCKKHFNKNILTFTKYFFLKKNHEFKRRLNQSEYNKYEEN